MEEILREILTAVKGLDSRMTSLESKVDENTQILRALEHKADVHKANLDLLNTKVAHIDGKLVRITDDINFLNMSTARNRYNIAELKDEIANNKVSED